MRALVLVLALAGCTTPTTPYTQVLSGLSGGLPSIWGSSAQDVWTVGGDAGDGKGPLVLHYDGVAWRRLPTGSTGDLWWVFGFPAGDVFVGGRGGQILSGRNGVFTRMPTPSSETVYGIWGTAPDDLWAVGGDAIAAGFVWRFGGSAWEAVTLPADAQGATIYKVWGTSRDDVWLVGADGLILRWDGASFTRVASGATREIYTVHARAGRAAAVGADGYIAELDGGAWHAARSRTRDGEPDTTPMNGVVCTDEGGVAVGQQGRIKRRAGDGWVDEDTGVRLYEDLHGVWVDPDGGTWAVGGQLAAYPLVRGVLLHQGADVPTTIDEGETR